MRITVSDVLGYLAGGMTRRRDTAGLSVFDAEDIRACLSFAADRERHLMTASRP